MDDIVKQAMAKWPNVPAVYGWLAFDRRGRWLIKGERVTNPVITSFIGRNYTTDASGCWFFQNGPQRVFVSLEYAPFVYRLEWSANTAKPPRITAHTGAETGNVTGAWLDEDGTVLLNTELGIGTVDDRDLEALLPRFTDERGGALSEDAVENSIERVRSGGHASLYFQHGDRRVLITHIASRDVPSRFHFMREAVQPEGQEKC